MPLLLNEFAQAWTETIPNTDSPGLGEAGPVPSTRHATPPYRLILATRRSITIATMPGQRRGLVSLDAQRRLAPPHSFALAMTSATTIERVPKHGMPSGKRRPFPGCVPHFFALTIAPMPSILFVSKQGPPFIRRHPMRPCGPNLFASTTSLLISCRDVSMRGRATLQLFSDCRAPFRYFILAIAVMLTISATPGQRRGTALRFINFFALAHGWVPPIYQLPRPGGGPFVRC